MPASTMIATVLGLLVPGREEPIGLHARAPQVLALAFEIEHRLGRTREAVKDLFRIAQIIGGLQRSPAASSRLIRSTLADPFVGNSARKLLLTIRHEERRRAGLASTVLGLEPSKAVAPQIGAKPPEGTVRLVEMRPSVRRRP